MSVGRILWFILASFLGAVGVVALSQPAMAVRPLSVRLETPEPPAAALSSAAAPGYLLRGCQVGKSVGACYDPYQMRHAYQIDSLISAGYDGTGRTIVIVDAYQNPSLVAQMAYFDSYYGLPAVSLTQIAPDGLTAFDPTDGNMIGWAEEISLDVAWAHAIAPGAKIVLVLAKSSNDPDVVSAVKYAVDNNLGDVISMSFGENESCVDPAILDEYHQLFAAATENNITLFASTGDNGAAQNTCDGNSWVQAASSPASDPLVTAVGATELHAAGWPSTCTNSTTCPSPNPVPGAYQGETAWNEGPPYGDFQPYFGASIATGGGYSVLFDQPSYQKASGFPGNQRAIPDVAYSGAVLHGVLVYLEIPGIQNGFYRFGGTSAGSPQWAAITAIAVQMAGGRLGFLNRVLYHAGRLPKTYPVTFNDVTSGTNSVVEYDSSGNPVTVTGFNAGIGWDATTGIGTPIGKGWVDYLVQRASLYGPSDIGDGPKSHPKSNEAGSMDPH